MRIRRDPRRWRRGSSAIEFALLAPFFALIAMGAYDLGNAVQASMRLERAARAGAQYALVHPRDLAGIQSAVRAAWPALGTADVPMPITSCACTGATGAGESATQDCLAACAGARIWTVTISAQQSITPLVLGGLRARSGSATVRVE